MAKTIDYATAQDMDLVNIINQTEGFAWRLNHDAGDGRIPDEGIDNSIKQLMETRNKAVAEITRRTGVSGNDSLKDYIRGKLKEQDNMWDTQWAEIFNEGTVFKPSEGNDSYVFETIRTYLPTHGTFGPNAYIFARVRDDLQFTQFDDRDITRLTKVPEDVASSLYANCSPLSRGLIKAHEEPVKRKGNDSGNNVIWKQLDDFNHTVFYHKGFDETFEAMERYNLAHMVRSDENEVILARSHIRPVFVEFTPTDLGLIEIVGTSPKYKIGNRYHLAKED